MVYIRQKNEVVMKKENEEIAESVTLILSEEEITQQEYDEFIATLPKETDEIFE